MIRVSDTGREGEGTERLRHDQSDAAYLRGQRKKGQRLRHGEGDTKTVRKGQRFRGTHVSGMLN